MAERTLILGGGFGGLATAIELRRLLGADHEIVVVDRREQFFIGLRKLWVLVGRATLADGERPRARLEDRGIRFLRTTIHGIDPAARRVETDEGTLEADRLVVALGAESRPDLVPGLEEHAFDLYDHTSVEAAARRVTSIERGRVAVIIAGLPYRCPPAPYEAAFLLDDHFRERGVRDEVRLAFATLQPGLLPNAGPEGARWIGERLTERGIVWDVGRRVLRFEPGAVVFDGAEGEERVSVDLAVVAPPHRAPSVVVESGLTGGGDWIAVDRSTLRTRFPGVYAIGDVTNIPLGENVALPKAGLFAEAEGLRVAREIAWEAGAASEPAPFDGLGHCYLEMGGGRAALIEGEFFREGGPAVHVREPTEANLEAKHRFEEERLEGWLGRR